MFNDWLNSAHLDCDTPTLFPFFLHVMWGVGSPRATHRNAAIPPALTRWSEGVSVITGGSAKDGEKRKTISIGGSEKELQTGG